MKSIQNDTPAMEDLLGYNKSVEALTQITKEVIPPFTIGIFSKWGFGKTSFMKMLKSNFNEDSKFRSIWFNPWKYDDKNILWKALISEIYSAIEEDDKITVDFIKKTFEKGINFAGKITGKGKVGTELFNIFKLEPQFLNEIEDITNKMINEYVGEDGRLIIFIDDLDRCLPENAIKILEAIKLFFDNTKCIFIVGLDKAIIEKGIHLLYDEKIEMSGIDYLEKIIQLPFNIPAIKNENIEGYISKMCDDSTMEACIEIIRAGSENNPRRIKRFLNIYRLQRNISEIENLNEKLLSKIVMLQLRYPNFYDFIVENPKYLNLLNNIIKMKKSDREEYFEKEPKLTVFYNEFDLVQFLLKTEAINCSDDKLVEYLRLANF